MEDLSDTKDEKSFKESLYSTLSILSQYPQPNGIETLLFMTIQILQELSMPLSSTFPWNKSYMFGISEALSYTRYLWVRDASTTVQIDTAYLIVAFAFVQFLYIALAIAVDYKKGEAASSNAIPLFAFYKGIMDFFVTIAYIPMLTILGHALQCNQGEDCTMVKTTPLQTTLFFFAIFFLFLFCSIHTITIYDFNPLSRNPFASIHHRHKTLSLFTRTVVVLFYSIFEIPYSNTIENCYLLSVLSFLHSILSGYSFFSELPYFNNTVNTLVLASQGLIAWASLSSVITVLRNLDSDSGTIWLFFIGIAPVMPSCMYAIHWRIHSIDLKPVVMLTSPLEIDIKIRMAINHVLSEFDKEQFFRNGSEFDFSHFDFSPVEELLLSSLRRFPDATEIYLAWASYSFFYKRNTLLAIAKLKFILRNEASPLEILAANVRLRNIGNESLLEDNETNIVRYVKQQRLEKEIRKNMKKCLGWLIEFWSHLSSENYSVEKMEELTYNLEETMRQLKNHLQQLLATDPSYPPYRQLYSQYLNFIANDTLGALNQTRIALELEALDKDYFYSGIDTIHAGVTIISGEADSMGCILQVNSKLCDIFGYEAIELLGKSINQLMPKPYAEIHNHVIQHYIDTTKTIFTTKKRVVIMRHQQGHVFQGMLHVLDYCNLKREPGICFLGSIKAEPSNICFCIAQLSDLIVVDVSSTFMTMMNIDLQQVRNNEYYLSNCIPEIEQNIPRIIKILDEESFYNMLITRGNEVEEEEEDIEFQISYLPYMPKTYLLIQICTGINDSKLTSMFRQLEDSVKRSNTNAKNEEKRKSRFINSGKSNPATSDMSFVGLEGDLVGNSIVSIKNSLSKVFGEKSNFSRATHDLETPKLANHETKKDPSSKINLSEEKPAEEEITEGSSIDKQESAFNRHHSKNIRLLLEKTHQFFEPELKKLIAFNLILMILIIALSIICQVFWIQVALPSLQTSIKLIQTASMVRWSIVTCTYTANIFQMLKYNPFFNMTEIYKDPSGRITETTTNSNQNSSSFPTSWTYYNTTNMLKQDLQKALGSFDDFRSIIIDAEGFLPSEVYNQLTDPIVPIASFDFVKRPVSQVESCHYFSTMISAIQNENWDSYNSEYLEFFLLNINSTFLSQVNSSIEQFQYYLSNTNVAIESSFFSIALTALAMSFAVFILLFLPTLYIIQKEKSSVYQLFQSMDKRDLRTMLANCRDHLIRFTAQEKILNQVALNSNRKQQTTSIVELSKNEEKEDELAKKEITKHSSSSTSFGFFKWLRVEVPKKTSIFRQLLTLVFRIFFNTSALKLFLQVLLAVLYFGSVLIWWGSRYSNYFLDVGSRTNYAGYRDLLVREILVEMTTLNTINYTPNINVERIKELEQSLWGVEQAVIFGDVEFDIHGDIRDWPYGSSSMSFSDPCSIMEKDIDFSLCEQYYHGIMQKGPHKLVLEFINLSEFLRWNYENLPPHNKFGNSSSLGSSISLLNTLQKMKEMGDIYLNLTMTLADNAMNEGFNDEVSESLLFHQVSLFLFLILNILLEVLVLYPLVKDLNHQIKKTRNTLLLVPDSALESSPTFREDYKRVMQRVFRGASY